MPLHLADTKYILVPVICCISVESDVCSSRSTLKLPASRFILMREDFCLTETRGTRVSVIVERHETIYMLIDSGRGRDMYICECW